MPSRRIILNEKEYVEEPLLRLLQRLGWRILHAGEEGMGDPAVTFRESFAEVVLEEKVKAALLRITPWLTEDQLPPLVRELTNLNILGGLVEKNRYVLEKLHEGSSAENRKTGRPESVQFIDFKNPENNEFIAISQLKVNIPGTEKHIYPDVVLFVNGLPLVVVECKSAYLPDPIGEAVEQLMRYQVRRGDDKEGNEKLFWYNQLVVASSKQLCRYSSVTGEFEHYVEWKDPYPFALNEIDTEGSESVTSQQIFVLGVLSKANFLDIIESFILFQPGPKGNLIKVVPRYQQFRTVQKMIARMRNGKTPFERGGTVWHTQGSGKSLTMMMAVRKMYHVGELQGFKVVFITDRKDLQNQLRETAQTIGYEVKTARKIVEARKFLTNNTPDIVLVMIHKFDDDSTGHFDPTLFGFHNDSENILVMIDEAHRTQYGTLGATLAAALPNAVKIAFTGTPIDRTIWTFGDYIDKYSIRQAVEDGVTVEIIYEGRTHEAGITDPEAMNVRFEDLFADASKESKRQILGRYTWKAYLEADETIRAKAEDMLKHYLTQIFPNGFKAQVVAVSRVAAIRYKQAIDTLLKDTNWLEEFLRSLPENLGKKIDREQLKRLRAEVIISGAANDKPEMKPYTDENKHTDYIAGFKLPFGKFGEGEVCGDIGILVVQSMLLTGFDAPIEQVMYLDDVIREHNLLQAIARVNRVEKNKFAGFIVDYVGITKHLREALSNFEDQDVAEVEEVFKDVERDLDELTHAKAELNEFFRKFGLDGTGDIDACVDILADDEARNDYLALFRKFTAIMDRALPKPEALKFAVDLKQFAFISQVARNRYRDDKFSLRDASKKIRDIVDEFLISKGVDPMIPPVPIFSEKFKLDVRKEESPRAKAETLKSAIVEQIEKHIEEDPELYERFSEKLEKLLRDYHDNWEQLAKELDSLLEEMRKGRELEENFGFDHKTEMPFLGLLKKEVFGIKEVNDLSVTQRELLVQTTKDILERIKRDVELVDFWNNVVAQRKLKAFIASHLLTAFRDNEALFGKQNALSQKIMELAFHLYGTD